MGEKNNDFRVKKSGIFRDPGQFLARLKKWYQDRQFYRKLTDHVVDTVEPRLKGVRGYRKKLRGPIVKCQEHCRDIVEKIPGPIFLKDLKYSQDPLIKAAFVGQDTIGDLLLKTGSLITHGESAEKTRVGLLTMTHNERSFLGSLREGQMVVGDARLTSITFVDHKIVGMATTLEESRRLLEKVILDVIIETASHELANRRANLGELRVQREKLKAMWKLFGGDSSITPSAVSEGESKREKVEALLEQTENELTLARQDNETPDGWLNVVVNYLSQPEKIMDIKLVSLRLDWRNVVTNNPETSADVVTFAQCTIHKEIKRDAVFIAYQMKP